MELKKQVEELKQKIRDFNLMVEEEAYGTGFNDAKNAVLFLLDQYKIGDCGRCSRPDLSEEEIRHIIAHLSYVRLESIHDVTNERIDVRRNVCPECTQVEAKLTKALKKEE